jgi:excisionase family DNA binding protein
MPPGVMTHASRSAAGRTIGPCLGRSVSLDQAARLLAVSRRTIYNWIRSGRLQTIRTVGGSQRVLVDSLREGAAGTPVQDDRVAGCRQAGSDGISADAGSFING